MKKQKKSQIITATALMVFGLLLVLSIFGLSRTVADIEGEVISREPVAILASAGVDAGTNVNLPVAYFDQKADECVNIYDASATSKISERQFEWASCGYNNKQLEQGLVEFELSDDYLPVAVGGKLLPNRGMTDIQRWFDEAEGKSKAYTGSLQLEYSADEVAEFRFESEEFYPLDEAEFSATDGVNKDRHNHLFTMNFAIPFTVMASGEENFEITADDDTFVFVGNELVLDMGGIHEAMTGKLTINENGEIYTGVGHEDLAYSGVQVAKGEGSIIRIFHADRDASDSVFKVLTSGMNLNIVQTQVASGDTGVQVAYDPSNPEYVGPLGESMVVRPDGTKGYMIIAIVLGVLTVTAAMFTAILAHNLIKNRQK